ncbi:unnamed protein product [Thlaspi arvense]|uniref:RNase H type-1 domain-containing protein n=1 Tax=Thlaspi arvense TaxID=13288 RepID=A0AAU9SUV8_THLAR|nr:unnamed protein product [Thlaspi arvense]
MKQGRYLHGEVRLRCVTYDRSPGSREVWELAPIPHDTGNTPSSQLLQVNIESLLSLENHSNKDVCLFPFIGWHIWKMKNNMMFQNRRDLIPILVNKTILDKNIWSASLKLDKNQFVPPHQPSSVNISLKSIAYKTNGFCCFVDGSWISNSQLAGIGWGKSVIAPTNSPLETEAEVVRMAALQLGRLRYSNITFCGDSVNLFNMINASLSSPRKSTWEHSTLSMYIKDIRKMAVGKSGFKIRRVPRNVIAIADRLAKKARYENSSHVINWL